MKRQNECVECGSPASRRMLCKACEPLYDDVCRCVSGRSDMADIIPCEKDASNTPLGKI